MAADRWPLMAMVAQRAGDSLRLEAVADLTDIARAPVKATLIAPAGQIDAGVLFDFDGTMGPLGPFDVRSTGLDMAFVAPPLTGKIDAAGELRITSGGDFFWNGEAVATDLTYPSGAIGKASGPLTIRKIRSTISWDAPSVLVEGGRITSLTSLAPDDYQVGTRGEVNLTTRIVEITQAQVRGAPGVATGRGTYTIRTGAIDFAGAASFERLSDIAPFTGSARGQWAVRRSTHTAPIRVTADASGRNVSSRIAALADLAGSDPNVVVSGVVSDGRFVVESGSFRGAGLAATMTSSYPANCR
jgi:hypothetical protein